MAHKHHTQARSHTNAHTPWKDGPTSPAARLSLDVRCCRQLHSSHLLWIYYLLCSSKHRFIFPRKSKRTDAHSVVLLKIRTFRDAATREADLCIRRKSKSPSWVSDDVCSNIFYIKKKREEKKPKMPYEISKWAMCLRESRTSKTSLLPPEPVSPVFFFFPSHAALQALQICSKGKSF